MALDPIRLVLVLKMALDPIRLVLVLKFATCDPIARNSSVPSLLQLTQ
jgi:hypothetical protein